MYRGSEGVGGRDEMGDDDLNNLMNVYQLSKELRSVDAKELYLYGESRGGMMVLQAIREGFPARAAATFGAPTNFFRLLEESPERYEGMSDQLWPTWREDPDAIFGRRSATSWPEKINIPLLLMHGGSDETMPPSQTLELASLLEDEGKTYELVIYGYDNHRISRHVEERDVGAIA
jgi:dipeptidyl aminopeptidase/acylaminoacyl peptidase